MRDMKEVTKDQEVKQANPNGRPPVNLDWNKIAELSIAGCTVSEIAGYCGCAERTIYDRCETDLGKKFTHFSQENHSKGDSLLRSKQFSKAIEGDNTLLIWLGKNRLKQSESPVDTALAEKALENFDAVMNQISSVRSALKIDDNKINEDNKS